MKSAAGLIFILLVSLASFGCGLLPDANREPLTASVRTANAIENALLSVLAGSWDGGDALTKLLAQMKSELHPAALQTIRSIAAEDSLHTVPVKAHARRWLAVKGYK